jgi:hypothetical protein
VTTRTVPGRALLIAPRTQDNLPKPPEEEKDEEEEEEKEESKTDEAPAQIPVAA